MKITKALTFRASSIGDCLMAKYLLENIHATFPDARCGIVVAGRSKMIKDLLANYPWIEVIEANRRNVKGLLYLWKNFRRSDLVVTQYTGKKGKKFSFLSKCMAKILARKGGCVGFEDASSLNHFFFDTTLPFSLDRAVASHEQEVLKARGIPVTIPFPTLSSIKNSDTKNIIVHLFAGGKGRGLHPDKKREIIKSLISAFPDMQIMISGGKEDYDEAVAISAGTRATVIAGKTSLQELMRLISESTRVVSVDTGVAHIVAQLGKQLVVLRTCVAPNWWFKEQYGPYAPITVLSADEVCGGNHIYKDYPVCINQISVKNIIEAL